MRIILIEDFPCNNKDELLRQERYWYDKLKPELNMMRSYLTRDELKVYNTDYCKRYYELNKNNHEYLSKAKAYRDRNKEKISERGRQWRIKNQAELTKKKKAYYEANKPIINKRLSMKRVLCRIGKIVDRGNELVAKFKSFEI